MTGTQTPQERFQMRRESSLFQAAVGQWLDAAEDDFNLASRLMAAGFEEAARVQAENGEAAVKQVTKLFAERESGMKAAAKAWVDHSRHLDERHAHAEAMLETAKPL
ncbi:hypothetical protein [Aquincola sp. J276]|uniref:hypothetical protein n=1 Tax=Aquincola sp. J276 TaxID=2898432 RepID=UPI002150AC84|nr:hypothetical protein [Aquincola sp. J276]MCR5865688.1 hypothetical protein [Aquincola sp. J276]